MGQLAISTLLQAYAPGDTKTYIYMYMYIYINMGDPVFCHSLRPSDAYMRQ